MYSMPLYEEIMASEHADLLDEVLDQECCDIEPDFLGFIHIYEGLARIIDKEYTVVDLGSAYAIQAWYFRDHKKYIAVDLPGGNSTGKPSKKFKLPNVEVHNTGIENFLDSYKHTNKEFAICNYVPNWYSHNIDLTKQHFQNVFTFYPCALQKG